MTAIAESAHGAPRRVRIEYRDSEIQYAVFKLRNHLSGSFLLFVFI